MIPIRLTVQGLYSYKESQTIDFEPLTASQLFGIFGTVGSGKSSILEAIVFALFDRSERLNSRDSRYYNMLNLQSQRLVIDFIFGVTAPEANRYRFTVTAQRKKKDYQSVEVKERRRYRWTEDDWQPLEVADASSLIGMTYENFMQTVIIPQGKFREFIDQKPSDRTQMLKELFRLEKFDLAHKTSHLLSEVRSRITEVEARLSEIGSVTPEAVEAAHREVQEYEISLRQNGALLKEAEASCQSYEHRRILFIELETAQQQRHELLLRQPEYQTKEKQLREYREAETYFNEKFATLANTTAELNRTRANWQRVTQQVVDAQQQLNSSRQTWEEAKAAYASRETIREQCHDLEHLVRICQVQAAHPVLASQEQEARLVYEWTERDTTATKQSIQETEQRLLASEQTQEQLTTLQDVARWCQQQQVFQAEHHERQQQVTIQQREFDQIDQRKQALLSAHPWAENGTFDNFYRSFDAQYTRIQHAIQKSTEELSGLKVRAELVGRAQQLKEGEACPLCGSTHHPSVTHTDAVKVALAKEEQQLAHWQAQASALNQLASSMRQLQGEFQLTAGQLESAQREQRAMEAKLRAHEAAFCWEEYQPQEAETIIQRAQQHDRQLIEQKQLRQQRTKQQQQLEKQEAERATAQQQWQGAQQALVSLQSKVNDYRSLLRQLSYERYQRFTEAQLRESLEKGQAKLAQVETRYEATREQYQESEKACGILEAKREAEQLLVDTLAARTTRLEAEIQTLCGEKEFDSVEYVKSLIDLEMDTEAVYEDILSYRNRLHAAEATHHRLQQETKDQQYDPLRHQEAQNMCAQLKQANDQLQHAWAVAKREIKEQQTKLIKIQELSRTLAEQQQREDNLKELASLFRGSGFVNYASTVLLEDVCRAANVRFKQLTKNNLSLELNASNDFIVRDYLNDGKTRLLKTLSGGQIFQAALCLALALAENIKSLNQSQQSFFFLDEGFGSLDKASLRVVFDTLKSLRQENRVVGIISHVEELQQEIDVYLKIEHDKERGSLVRGSWEG